MKTLVCSFRSGNALLILLTLACAQSAYAQTSDSSATVSLYATDSHASEGGSDTGAFTVVRTGSTNFPLAVFYQLSGSASNGADYEPLGASVQIPAGGREASFIVRPIDDSLVEGNESVVAQLTGSPLDCATCGYDIGVPGNAVVVILDNDSSTVTNQPPRVGITTPLNGAVLSAPTNITIFAEPFDIDGFVTAVEFFEGTNSLGFGMDFAVVGLKRPFVLTWSNVTAGFYELTAVATDDKGATGVSSPVRVIVVETNLVPQPVVNIYAVDDTGSEIPVVPPWLGVLQRADPIVFTVTRSGPTNLPLTVFYSVGGTASNRVDYFDGAVGFDQGLSGHVTISAGASSAQIPVVVVDDYFVEGTETLELTVQPPACIQIFPPPPDCYLVGPGNPASARILDDDVAPPPIVTIVATDPEASESGPDNGRFTVSRTGDTSRPLPVFYHIGGTAETGADYLAFTNIELFYFVFVGANVVIPAGANSADMTVTPIDDLRLEGSETVALQLQQPPWAGYVVGAPGNAVVTIADNDADGTNHAPIVRLNAPQNGDAFKAPATIELRAYAQDAEDGYHLEVEFFEGTNSLGFGTFEPTTCPDPYCPFYALTWPDVPPGEYVLTARATDHDGNSSVSDPVRIIVGESVNIDATDPLAGEQPMGSDGASFTVSRSGGTNASIVVYYEITGTASNGVDFETLPGQVTLPEGVWSAEIIVEPVDDYLAEGTETVVLTLLPTCPQCLFSNPPCLPPQTTNCYPIGTHNQAVAYIRDDDATNLAPVVNIVARDPLASEGTNFWRRGDGGGWAINLWDAWHVNPGGTNTATFVVRRHGTTNDPLVVPYDIGGTAGNGLDYVALPGLVTVPAGKRTAQIVVRPLEDTLTERIETVVLKLQPSPDYEMGSPSRAAAIILDNDRPRPPCVLLPDHLFHFCESATNGFCFRIEASTDLHQWAPLCTNVVTDGALHFVDPDALLLNARFYRVSPEPGLLPDD